MGMKRMINGVHVVPMGMANAFLIEGVDGLTLIDAGRQPFARPARAPDFHPRPR
jgi:hypothetical protein